MSLAETIARSLGNAKKTPEGWLCRCPCHEDRKASLSLAVNPKTNGITINCFAGCKWEDIKKEIEARGLLEKRTTSTLPTKSARTGKYEGAKFYVYKDLVGNILCRKVKLPSKKMWFERFDPSSSGQWIAGLAGATIPLYNLQSVLESQIIYLCEGEKDAETLIAAGFCGTTNHAGATSWGPHLTEQLKGKTIIIIPDNDEAGRKRVSLISKALQGVAKEIRVFVPPGVPEHGDITDWAESGGDLNTILGASVVVDRKAAPKKATHEEYYELFDTVLNNPRRCIFNEKLMYRESPDAIWNPAINALDRLRARALIENESREAKGLGKFCLSHIQPLFFEYESIKPLEFLVDVPQWDNVDRISEMAYLMKLKPEAGVSEESFSELLKEWCSRVFVRLEDPYEQNRILVLQGGQGVGKDTWISMLVDGLGQFSIPLAIVKEDKDTYLNLHRGLIMKISEFDKTARAEVSTLKDIITAPNTNLRAPYDKDSKLRYSRCSFIASANAEQLLRDPTGNRRFLIFEVDSIEYGYEGWSRDKCKEWRMQCLAQMKHLAEVRYVASNESWREMREYIDRHTPTEYAADIVENFIADYHAEFMGLGMAKETEIKPQETKVRTLIEKLAKQNGMRFGVVKGMIQSKLGKFKRIGGTKQRQWTWVVPGVEPNRDLEESRTRELLQMPMGFD